MVRVFQDKTNIESEGNIKRFVVEEDGAAIGGGQLVFDGDCVLIEEADVKKNIALNYYDLLIRSMLHFVRDMGDIKIGILCPINFEQTEKFEVFKKLGFYKDGDYCIVKAKDINFKGSCNG